MLISLDRQLFICYSVLLDDYTEISVDPHGALERETDHMITAFHGFCRSPLPYCSEHVQMN